MIGWLQGQKIETWQVGLHHGVIISCGGIGYEVQVLPREQAYWDTMNSLTIWIHQIFREDGSYLFGFSTRQERDLFRVLIGVNGVGAQIGLALLEEWNPKDLVNAIIQEDLNKLSKAQGVGKRIAERITLELRNKISDFTDIDPKISLIETSEAQALCTSNSIFNELSNELSSLGYEAIEIKKAINAISSQGLSKAPLTQQSPNPLPSSIDALLKESLRWLSQEAA